MSSSAAGKNSIDTPACKFIGVDAMPLVKYASACSALMLVLVGAPSVFCADGRPKPSQMTVSVAWHTLCSMLMSSWQSAGQYVALAARHEYGVTRLPLTTMATGLNAVCA